MKKIPKWIKAIIVLIIFYLLIFLRLPYYLEVPGNVFSLDAMVEVDNQFIDNPGDFYITTVGIQKTTPITMLSSFLPYRDLVSEAELFGEFEDVEAYDKIQAYNMQSSINNAIKVAFDAAGKDYTFDYKGVYVMQIMKESSFFSDLKTGDTVKSVDGNQFQSSQEFIAYIANKNVGDKVILDVEREQEDFQLSGELVKLDSGLAGIGISLVDDTTLVTEPAVSIHSANIGGPSAGLMFSLEIYTKLIADDIRGSFDIAGSGTIETDGKVGRIGGIEKKVVAADKAGVDYFLAPDDEITADIKKIRPDIQSNYQVALATAKKIDTKMEIIPVQTIYDAIDFLEKLGKEERAQKLGNVIALSLNSRNLEENKQVAYLTY